MLIGIPSQIRRPTLTTTITSTSPHLNTQLTSITLLLLLLTHTGHGKVFERCELAEILIQNKIPLVQLRDWLCTLTWGTGFNSSFRYNYNTKPYFGLFLMESRYPCMGEGDEDHTVTCKLDCKELLNEDLQDDIQCARIAYIESQGFPIGPLRDTWVTQCEGKDLKQYTKGCLEEGDRPPTFVPPDLQHNVTLRSDLQNQYIICVAKGIPPPAITWTYNMTKLPDAFETIDHTLGPGLTGKRLIVPSPTFDEDIFNCQASNEAGIVFSFFLVTVVKVKDEPPDLGSVIRYEFVIPIAIVVVAVAVIVSLMLYRKYWIRLYGLTKGEVDEFENGSPSKLAQVRGSQITTFNPELFQFLPYDKRYEIKVGELNIKKEEMLGSGHFGVVFKGILKGALVAVKVPKGQADNTYIKALLTEIKIMIHIGNHANVVNLIGAQTKALSKGLLNVAVELCELGDLEKYLRCRREYYVDPTLPSSYISGGTLISEANQAEPLTYLDLIIWSTQIASGMAHLERKKVLHGDLACRNVLLFNKSSAKISDFGLSRQLYTQSNYVKTKESPLPWRWMAIESLTRFSFGTKSDIWSFGVTLWEIFSLGDVPYPGISWSQEFTSLLKSGMRLMKPERASKEIYEIMQHCWQLEPDTRPDFSTLEDTLARYRSDTQFSIWRINAECLQNEKQC